MMPKLIQKFILKHHVFTISANNKKSIWSAHCFYAFDKNENFFVFTSAEGTLHAKIMSENPNVAVSIVLETTIIGKIQGLQMYGTVFQPTENEKTIFKEKYIKRFPYSLLMPLSIWVFKPMYAKMTDNALGFGKKTEWSY